MADLGDQPGGGVDLSLPSAECDRRLGVGLRAAFGKVERERGSAALEALPFALGRGEGVFLAGVGEAQALQAGADLGADALAHQREAIVRRAGGADRLSEQAHARTPFSPVARAAWRRCWPAARCRPRRCA